MAKRKDDSRNYVDALRKSGLSIYHSIDSELWIPAPNLEQLLDKALRGFSVKNYPLRSRSNIVKELICTKLGYPVPKSFKKTRPRFPEQNFYCYVQKSNN